jgi:DNA-binding NarL/FixJ family response regulator
VLSPAVTRPLLDLVHQASGAGPPEREREVALAVAGGATNAEIARQLYVSAATVKATVSRILARLELDNRVQIAVVVRGSRPR